MASARYFQSETKVKTNSLSILTYLRLVRRSLWSKMEAIRVQKMVEQAPLVWRSSTQSNSKAVRASLITIELFSIELCQMYKVSRTTWQTKCSTRLQMRITGQSPRTRGKIHFWRRSQARTWPHQEALSAIHIAHWRESGLTKWSMRQLTRSTRHQTCLRTTCLRRNQVLTVTLKSSFAPSIACRGMSSPSLTSRTRCTQSHSRLFKLLFKSTRSLTLRFISRLPWVTYSCQRCTLS